MVGIQELLIIKQRAAGGAPRGKRPAVRPVRRPVDSVQYGGQRFCQRMHPAPGADNAVLRLRVLLPLRRSLVFLRDARHLRPGGPVAPVGILCQHAVGRQQRFIRILIHILAVRAAARPVHQPGRFKRRRIVDRHRRIDRLCDLAGHRLVFVGGHVSVQRKDDTKARRPGPVLARRIHRVAAPEPFHPAQKIFRTSRRDVVGVQCHPVPFGDMSGAAFPSFQHAEHISSDVFQLVLLRFRQPQIGLQRFRAAYRRFQPAVEILKAHALQRPMGCPARTRRRYL